MGSGARLKIHGLAGEVRLLASAAKFAARENLRELRPQLYNGRIACPKINAKKLRRITNKYRLN
jgi:hypothetical protein